MQINFSSEIKNLDGKPLTEGDLNVTLGTVAVTALLASYNDEPGLKQDEKLRRFKLALKLHEGGVQDITTDDIALVKSLVAKAYSTLVVGRVDELVEQKNDNSGAKPANKSGS